MSVVADHVTESAAEYLLLLGRLQAALSMWWGTAAERMMPLSLCQNWQLGKLNKEIQL